MTMSEVLLRESVTEAPKKAAGNRWRVIVARPGKGSSGFYSEELFRRDAAKIIAPGGQAFLGHDDNRSVKDLIGVYPDGAMWSEEDKAVVADLQVFSHWQPFVEEVAPHVGMSLYAAGEKDDEDNVTAFIEDAYNGCDMVARPGLTGSKIDKMYESAKALDSKEPAVIEAEENGSKMSVEEKLDKLTSAFEAFVAAQGAKAQESAQVAADEAAAEAAALVAVEAYSAKVEAIAAVRESILPSQFEALMAEAKEGRDVTAAIESAKKVAEEAKAHFVVESAVPAGRVFGASEAKSATDLGKVFG